MARKIAPRPVDMTPLELRLRMCTTEKIPQYTWKGGAVSWCYECGCGERLFHVREDPTAWITQHRAWECPGVGDGLQDKV